MKHTTHNTKQIARKRHCSMLNVPCSMNKGISLLFMVIITSVILALSLGTSAIIIQQVRMTGEIGHSVVSFYAADSGIEEILYDLYRSPAPQAQHSDSFGDISFSSTATCGADVAVNACPIGFTIDADCNAANFCLKSTGTYQQTKRALEIKY